MNTNPDITAVSYCDQVSLRLGEGVSVTALSSPTEIGTLLDQNTSWLGDDETNEVLFLHFNSYNTHRFVATGGLHYGEEGYNYGRAFAPPLSSPTETQDCTLLDQNSD